VQPASDGSDYKFGEGFGFEFGARKSIFDIVNQTVTLTSGCPYYVNYTLTVPDKGTNGFQPYVDGQKLNKWFDVGLGFVNAPAGVYYETGIFHSTSSSATIAFGGYVSEAYLYLTNIKVFAV
jgi:hypothetical protein